MIFLHQSNLSFYFSIRKIKNVVTSIKTGRKTNQNKISIIMFTEGAFIIYQGHLREVVGEFNDSLIIDNGIQYVIIPGGIHQIFNLSNRVHND